MLTIRYLAAAKGSNVYEHLVPKKIRTYADEHKTIEYGPPEVTYALWRTLREDKRIYTKDGDIFVKYAELLYDGQLKGNGTVVDFGERVAYYEFGKEYIIPRSHYPIHLDDRYATSKEYGELFATSGKAFVFSQEKELI